MLIGIFSSWSHKTFAEITSDCQIQCNNSDKIAILDTDDYVLQFISYSKLYDIVKEGTLDFYNIDYDKDENSVGANPLNPNLAYLDNSYILPSTDGLIELYSIDDCQSYIINGVRINGKRIEFSFEKSMFGEYKFIVNGEQVGWFYTEDYTEDGSIDTVADYSTIGISLVYRISKEYVGVVFCVNCDEFSYFSNCLLIFDLNGNFVDMYQSDSKSNFTRCNDKLPASNIVSKCVTLKKGLYTVC